MAPEVMQSQGHDTSADIWSLGILMYSMVLGYYPFEGDTREKLKENIINKEISFT